MITADHGASRTPRKTDQEALTVRCNVGSRTASRLTEHRLPTCTCNDHLQQRGDTPVYAGTRRIWYKRQRLSKVFPPDGQNQPSVWQSNEPNHRLHGAPNFRIGVFQDHQQEKTMVSMQGLAIQPLPHDIPPEAARDYSTPAGTESSTSTARNSTSTLPTSAVW